VTNLPTPANAGDHSPRNRATSQIANTLRQLGLEVDTEYGLDNDLLRDAITDSYTPLGKALRERPHLVARNPETRQVLAAAVIPVQDTPEYPVDFSTYQELTAWANVAPTALVFVDLATGETEGALVQNLSIPNMLYLPHHPWRSLSVWRQSAAALQQAYPWIAVLPGSPAVSQRPYFSVPKGSKGVQSFALFLQQQLGVSLGESNA
jgi:hypothetical protein